MLRHGAAVRPNLLIVTACIAVAAMSATAMMVFHVLDASAIVLMWNFGITAVIVGLGAVFGRRLLDA